MSTMPPALVMNAASPPVLVPKNLVTPPALVVIVALPALLAWKKFVLPLLVMVASPAVAVPPGPKKSGAKLSSANWLTVIVAFSALLVPVKKMNPLVSAPMGRVGRPAMSVALPAIRVVKFNVRSKSRDRRVISRAVPLEKYEAAGEVIGTAHVTRDDSPGSAVVPSWKFTELVPSTWMDAASALLWSKKFIMLSPPTVKVAVPALLVS